MSTYLHFWIVLRKIQFFVEKDTNITGICGGFVAVGMLKYYLVDVHASKVLNKVQ